MTSQRIRVITLNLAHGRKTGFNQALQRRTKIRSNLDDVATLLNSHQPDVVALQEADGPSLWSGRFNHVEYLAQETELPHFFRGDHVKMLRLSYGTAVMSSHPIVETQSYRFAPSPPMPPKGFVLSTVHRQQPDGTELIFDVVSIHLDFARRNVRLRQCEEMVELLERRQRPLVIMGDFNCEWSSSEQTLRRLTNKLDLHTYQPDDRSMITFPTTRKRIDWVLCSKGFQFVRHEVLQDQLSDHRAIVAELDWVGDSESGKQRKHTDSIRSTRT